MEQMKEKKIAKKKHLIGLIVLFIAIIAIVLPTLKIYADAIAEAIIEDEKTIVRTAAALAKGESTNNIVEIDTLETHLDKLSGNETTATEESSELIAVTFADTGNIYYINIYTGPTFDTTDESIPYLPNGYTPVAGTDLTTGFVIEDESGNQFVWVEVPRTEEVYQTAGIDITTFTQTEYDKIEADLHTYTSVYRDGTTYTDTWSSEDATNMTENEYYIQKRMMLKSIYKYGGFYVGRYETGEDGTISAGQYADAAMLSSYYYGVEFTDHAESFGVTGYTSSLLFGVQWDLILKYLETKGTSQDELITDSSAWGNYDGAGKILTGSVEEYSKQNIYDLAGNYREMTLEYSGDEDYPVSWRGGFERGGLTASDRWCEILEMGENTAYRVALYKISDITETPSYIPTGYTHVAGTDMDSGFVIEDDDGNQFVWIEVPKTIYSNSNYNTETTAEDRKPTSGDDFNNIEYCLKAYTDTYKSETYADTWFSEDATGLTETEYNEQKKKMLKSIYKHGGFYLGRYETGIDYSESPRDAEGDITQTPVIKQHAYPYNGVTISQAQTLSGNFATTGYTSGLMFGVQWDLILKYLEEKGIDQEELTTMACIDWGNYKDSTYHITDENVKMRVNWGAWTSQEYNKTTTIHVLLTTGSTDQFMKQNIYDLAGNLREFTYEYSQDTEKPVVLRDTGYGSTTTGKRVSARAAISTTSTGTDIGYRVSLYTDEEIPQTATYTLTLNANGGTFTDGDEELVEDCIDGLIVDLSEFVPNREGYSFTGWATTSTATTAEYDVSDTIGIQGDTTLYAVWNELITINFFANEGYFGDLEEGTASERFTCKVVPGSTFTIPDSCVPTREGYAFLGFGSSSSQSYATFGPGSTISAPSSDAALYAIWRAYTDGTGYTIEYDANGGTFEDGSTIMGVIDTTGAITTEKPIKAGYTFVYWYTKSDANFVGTKYYPGGWITLETDIKLYAIYESSTTSKLDEIDFFDTNHTRLALVPKKWSSIILGF